MTDDAADDDDERLKSLRAVWLSMPDEDPPERGLADLMAAARVKADEMAAKAEPATPSLWQRFLDLMRQPPVLALATVMVLIGGAALVGRRGETLESSPTIAPTQTAPEPMTTTLPMGTAAPAAAEDNAAPPVSDPGSAPAAGSAMVMPTESARPETGAERPGGMATGKHSAPSERKAMRAPAAEPTIQEKQDTVRRAPAADSPVEQTQAFDDGELAKDTDAPKKTRGPSPAPPKEEAKLGGASATSTLRQDSTGWTGAADLHKAARDAAARGDCATAQQDARIISVKDARYYEQKVANDPALKSCLER